MVDTLNPLEVNVPQPIHFVFLLCHVLEFARLEKCLATLTYTDARCLF